MDFITIKVSCSSELTDVLIAELFELGFDSFQELEDGFEGSCDQTVFDKKTVETLFSSYPTISFEIQEQEKVNWNEEWEKNYDPIIVGDKCIVRASFHDEQPSYPYQIIVTPKMSFGTGHHATTYQVLDYQMTLNHDGKRVLDVGTGTGILAIMAKMRGASSITATDIDEWCIENSEENFALNGVTDVSLIKGQISEVALSAYDIVLANINKNVLLDQIEAYAKLLVHGGQLILSGFYEDDIDDLLVVAEKFGLKKLKSTTRSKWAMLALNKPSV